ncbi:acyltransferase [Paenibacillus sp. LMG 31459]|uniref:Acyltransferase n=1 Tax=Paenibacillus phytohabitans TaxID=2654978 RepID=A0ABX1YS87_9BACL|nr:acyltransferase [Paenibacillus phytohabitans]NOU82459.1 acyltransferase [Paenibacillus phytohabitans]
MIYLTILFRVVYNFIRLNFIKLFRYNKFIFTPIQLLSVNTKIDIRGGSSKFHLLGRINARRDVTFAIRNGSLVIGRNVFFNSGCSITCHEDIKIGDNCLFGPNVLFYDHDHIYGQGKLVNTEGYTKAPIELGQNIFIGANSIILKGTTIGDNCVIGAGTILKGNIPPNSLVYQKKEIIINPIV